MEILINKINYKALKFSISFNKKSNFSLFPFLFNQITGLWIQFLCSTLKTSWKQLLMPWMIFGSRMTGNTHSSGWNI